MASAIIDRRQEFKRTTPPLRRLWQVPCFLFGVFALALVITLKAYLPRSVDYEIKQAYRSALEALEAGDATRARTLAEQALALGNDKPLHQGDCRFVIGCSFLLAAQDAPEPERKTLRRRALVHLQAAERIGVSSIHLLRLNYRMAKLEYLLGGEPERLTKIIEKNLEWNAADREDGYQLLLHYHLDRPEPNLEMALQATDKLLALPLLARPNPIRLQRGELLLKLHRSREARQMLERIPPVAPEYAAARHFRALSHYQDEEYQNAAELWAEAAAGEPRNKAYFAPSLYHVGLSYTQLDRLSEANDAWIRLCTELPLSAEAQAAAFHLADLRRRLQNDDDALRHFRQGIETLNLSTPNGYLDLPAIREIVEKNWTSWLEAGKYELARQLGQHYERISQPGEGLRRYAVASQGAGLSKLQQLDEYSGPEMDRQLAIARRWFREAADAFETVANQRPVGAEQGDLLWAAAENHLRAQEYTRAAVLLERYLTLDIPKKRNLEALVGLGEANHALKQTDKAIQLLKEALQKPGPLHTRARYLLALSLIEKNQLAEAESVLRESLATANADAEPADYKQSLFALGNVLFRRGQFGEAATYLKQAIDKYPRDPQVATARYWMAQSHRQAADQETKLLDGADSHMARDFFLKQRKQRRELALAAFRQLAFDLSDRKAQQALTRDEENLLRKCRFAVADCLYNLGHYDEAAAAYSALAEAYHHRVEGLSALAGLLHVHMTVSKWSDAKEAAEQARETLARLSDQELIPSQWNRHQWQQWIDNMESQSKPVR